MAVTIHRYNQAAKLFLNQEVPFTNIRLELITAAAVAAFNATHTKRNQADSGGSATVTISIASPAVVTDTAHGMANGQSLQLTTTGALATGLNPGDTVFVVGATTNTYNLALTSGGAAINTSGSQSGVHTRTSSGSGEVSGNGWNIGGMTLTTVAASIRSTSGAALSCDNLSVTATGGDIGPAYGCIIYEYSKMNLLWLVDFGQVETAGVGTNMLIVFDPTGTPGTMLLLS